MPTIAECSSSLHGRSADERVEPGRVRDGVGDPGGPVPDEPEGRALSRLGPRLFVRRSTPALLVHTT
jgi:hypothetical protein